MTTIPQQSPNGVVSSRLVRFWKCWSNNCRGRTDYGLYVTHAVTDTGERTLCGVRIQEISDEVTEDNPIGCAKCQRSMNKANDFDVATKPAPDGSEKHE